jgi:hypothetical protein
MVSILTNTSSLRYYFSTGKYCMFVVDTLTSLAQGTTSGGDVGTAINTILNGLLRILQVKFHNFPAYKAHCPLRNLLPSVDGKFGQLQIANYIQKFRLVQCTHTTTPNTSKFPNVSQKVTALMHPQKASSASSLDYTTLVMQGLPPRGGYFS